MYGLSIRDLPADKLNDCPADWPMWTVAWAPLDGDPPGQVLDSDHAVLWLQPTGAADISGADRRTVLHTQQQPGAAALLHPYLGSTAVTYARWEGRSSLHAGCFLDDSGDVWAILGDRGAGKTSALAWLHMNGFRILADDLLVTDGRTAFAGPRVLDLREDAAAKFGLGEFIGQIGSRERWRAALNPVPALAPLKGFIRLGWNDDLSIDTVALPERLRALATNRGLRVGDEPIDSWFRLVSLPMVAMRRPRDWSRLDLSMGALLEALRRE